MVVKSEFLLVGADLMTAYLDEYNPNSTSQNFRVQSDPQELKYNNIQSCIAVAIYPSATQQLVGVHLTTATTTNPKEMKIVRDELRQALGNVQRCNAYLVGNYRTHHTNTTLKRELSKIKIVSSVLVCDVSPVGGQNTSADIDVKIKLQGVQPRCYVRSHAPFITPPGGVGRVDKQKPEGGWKPGQPRSQVDKTGREWMVVDFVRG
jgi:hypothetical protein